MSVKHLLCLLSFLILSGFYVFHKPKPYVFPSLEYFPQMPESKDNVLTEEGVELGRYLFYDSILSDKYNISCGTCHQQQYAFSGGPERFSKGQNAVLMKRNTLPLFNLAWYSAYFWDGRAKSIEEQVFHPVRHPDEMNLSWKIAALRLQKSSFYKNKFYHAFGKQTIDSLLITKAIAQFLRTLISHESPFDRALKSSFYIPKQVMQGFELVNEMTKGDCMHCHPIDGSLLGTTGKFSNNGLEAVANPDLYVDKGLGAYTKKISDNGKFKIPSLRNLAFTAPYMHDGRFNTLKEVLDFYSEGVNQSANIDSKMALAHKGGVKLTEEEKETIIIFLGYLSDTSFTKDPKYSNPFRKQKNK